MNGKNVEKLVLSNRLAISAIVLAVLVFATVPHLSNQRQQSLDSMLSSTNFNTLDFTPAFNVEIPIAGETVAEAVEAIGDEKPDAKAQASADTEEYLDPELLGMINSLKDVNGLNDSLIQRKLNHEKAKEAARKEQATSNASSNGYSYTTRKKSTTTTSTPAQNTTTTTSQPSRKSSSIDYSRVVYTDDNGEAIDSPDYKGIPSPDDNGSSPDANAE